MQTIDLLTLIPRAHEAAKAKGFWDVTPPKGQQLMLVISELAEALEADRKKDRAPKMGLKAYQIESDRLKAEGWELLGSSDPGFHPVLFEQMVKDTVGDELADAYIRLCDYAGGFGLPLDKVLFSRIAEMGLIGVCADSFGENLLGLTYAVLELYNADDAGTEMGVALASIEFVAKHYGIDLATHIDLKLAYNATRPAKHGKAY